MTVDEQVDRIFQRLEAELGGLKGVPNTSFVVRVQDELERAKESVREALEGASDLIRAFLDADD